jgi:hypothetical protein
MQRIIRRVPGWAVLSAIFVAAIVGTSALRGESTPDEQRAAATEERALQPLDAPQCAAARSMARQAIDHARATFGADASAAPALRTLEGEYSAAVAWIDAGCPPDSARGFIPAADGQGGQIRIFRVDGFSFGGTAALGSGGDSAIALVPTSSAGR